MTNKLEMSVDEIPSGMLFCIPWYQRGYRWTQDEINALLNDLLIFGNNPDETEYCLQPLVLQEKANGETLVVDGQQRLTTIYLIMWAIGIIPDWDIIYMTENNRRLSELLKENADRSINDDFRKKAREAIEARIKPETREWALLKNMLTGTALHKVVFLKYTIAPDGNGHQVFKRLNDGKTPLTSSELIRALFMEAGNGLEDYEKGDIAKEWDLIESSMKENSFWAIWNNRRFEDVPTRMDFLFSVVEGIAPEETRQDPLLIYRQFEKRASDLKNVWEKVLRCWWWMQFCYEDDELYHLLGWLSLCTDNNTYVLYRDCWLGKNSRIADFKQSLRRKVAENIGDNPFDSFVYGAFESEKLRRLFLLLNILEAQHRHIRFRFDLYKKHRWTIEHIASQTDNPLAKTEERLEWLELAKQEIASQTDINKLECMASFEEKWKYVFALFEEKHDVITDKDKISNLTLLDASTNSAYKNAIFPAKRRKILEEARNPDKYIPPITEAVFAKSYSSAAQMRYWGQRDADQYYDAMKSLFDNFMESAK